MECIICTKVKCREELNKLICSHIFCKSCVNQWIATGAITCPLCRCSVVYGPFKPDDVFVDEDIFPADRHILIAMYQELSAMNDLIDRYQLFHSVVLTASDISQRIISLISYHNRFSSGPFSTFHELMKVHYTQLDLLCKAYPQENLSFLRKRCEESLQRSGIIQIIFAFDNIMIKRHLLQLYRPKILSI